MPHRTLRLILGDQLNREHSWFKEVKADITYLFIEAHSEQTYVKHHVQKVIGFFLGMRAFAQELREQGHTVHYVKLDDPTNKGSIAANIEHLVGEWSVEEWGYQLPDEYRLDRILHECAEKLAIPVEVADTEHFLTSRADLKEFFEGKKTYLMESFYRMMRKRYDILMEENGKDPLTGQWNYDKDNRKKLPAKLEVPEPWKVSRKVQAIVDMLKEQQVETIGSVKADDFDWPVTRAESLDLLEHFIAVRLAQFGDFQDAMVERDTLLFHARISFSLNTKMISPLEVIQRVEGYYRSNPEEVSISQVEGFIRQILGWREYMRGIYWAKMPEYAELNYFDHQAELPEFFWTGETKMNCLKHAIGQSLEEAYAHHIQRLMVTGNFALLLGVHPDAVDAWYLGIYMDAIEWVEITNTRGMSQFADGGIVGTKPYISSANYIHKMSDYCKNCHYDRKLKTGEGACPFNSLYWDFYDRHADKLGRNPRVGMMYRTWNKMEGEKRAELLKQAAHYKERANEL